MTTPPRRIRVAVDIGGTFTDLQVLDEDSGRLWEFKTPTTPRDPSVGLITGLREAAESIGIANSAFETILHGTTIATNAVLERKFPDCVLITTSGFEDVLEIGRHMRRDVYGLYAEERPVLVPRGRRFGVGGRMLYDGTEVQPLVDAELSALGERLRDSGIKVVAICLLHAYANPAHEQRLRDALLAADPGLYISLSSDISPEIREYERTSTTVLNALLMPVVRSYMEKLQRNVRETSPNAGVLLVQSNGGVCGPQKAGEHPVGLLLSGPCGGALAVEQLAQRLAMPQLIGIDMGGTSSDVTVINEGRSARVTEGNIEGIPVRLPMVDIRTIGTGGGSIAWIDRSGRLRVGPQSAGADPGPACYGRGGDKPTVTDANLVLGRIDPNRFADGRMKLDVALSRGAIGRDIGGKLNLSIEEAAEGIVAISTSNMAQAIRLSLFERGLDPADFALVSFGGAGGLHAAPMAQAVGIQRVIYPRAAGTFSAYGMLWSDIVHDLAKSRIQFLTEKATESLRAAATEMQIEANALLERDRVPPQRRRFLLSLDLRYRGQGYELTVPLAAGGIEWVALADAGNRFHAMHEQRFEHADRGSPIEIVTLRLTAIGEVPKPAGESFVPVGKQAPSHVRRAIQDGGWNDTPVYDRRAIGSENPIAGPAIIDEAYSTILLPAGWSVKAAVTGDLVARHESRERG